MSGPFEKSHHSEGASTPRPASSPRPASMLIKGFGAGTMELLILVEMMLAFLCIPCAVAILISVLRHATDAVFAPSDDRQDWVAGPTRRGTMNIIWLCASTIYTCVHVSVHIDVPNTEQNFKHFEKGMAKLKLSRWMSKALVGFLGVMKSRWVRHAVWICFNIFAPEMVVMVALLEFISARDAMKFMHSCGQTDWNLTLAFFADMGGFGQWQEVKAQKVQMQDVQAQEGKLADEATKLKEERSENRDSGSETGIKVIGMDRNVKTVRHYLTGRQFLEWFQKESQGGGRFTPEQLELIEADIKDRSDRSLLLKLITFSQASWFFVETMLRLAEPVQAVSQMEIATCAYIFCTLISYLFWLKKPYHISGHIILPQHLDVPADVAPSLPWGPLVLPEPLVGEARFTPFNRSFHPNHITKAWILSCAVSGLVGALVGAIHGAPLWEVQLIDTHGQWLWRASSIVQFALPLAISSSGIIEQIYDGKFLLATAGLLSFIYAVSRFVIMGLVYVSFWSLPDSVYNNIDWSSAYFPHWH